MSLKAFDFVFCVDGNILLKLHMRTEFVFKLKQKICVFKNTRVHVDVA